MKGSAQRYYSIRNFKSVKKIIVLFPFLPIISAHMEPIYNFTLNGLKDKLASEGFPGYTATQIFNWVYKEGVSDFGLMTNISKDQKAFLNNNFSFSNLKIVKKEVSCDKTVKFLFQLEDNPLIETVLIPDKARATVCLSTQAGCKFKCIFCVSGEEGFKRNLTPAEIIGQYSIVTGLETKNKITNIVFMGIGEPLDNFENTINSIKILTDPAGINFSKRKITISSCGLVPGIKELAEVGLRVKLSISLHSADEKIRNKLMPINKKYPLKQLIPAIKYFSQKTQQPITFEYISIQGLNIEKEDATKIAQLLSAIKAKLNLIPYNGVDSRFRAPAWDQIVDFQNELKKRGIFATIRKSRGQDIKAACGQLRAQNI